MKSKSKYQAVRRADYKAPAFLTPSINLTFELSDDHTVVRSSARYKRVGRGALRLNGEGLTLKSLRLDGTVCKYKTEKNGDLILEDVPDEFELQIENEISPIANTELMGLYKSNGTYCTQCEPEGFRRITYFQDRPDVLSRFKVTILGPEYGCGVLLSNGNLVDSGTRDGRQYAVWEDPFPKPCYLFALVAGTFDILNDSYTTKSGRKVQLSLYVDRGAIERAPWAMESIKSAMRWDEERWGLEYDLDNFKVVAVDFFNQGAMENKSLNIFNSIYVLVDKHSATDRAFFNVQSVIGHEYFHNYTGDRVTLRDWFQLSLKESLTVFRDQEFSSDVASRTLTRLEAVNVIRGAQFAEDASPMAHPVRPDEVMEMNNFYTVTIYDKGAEIIRMIHTLIGEEAFAAGLRLYLKRFDGQAVTVDDFIGSMQEASGFDFTAFMRWYSQRGTPRVEAGWQHQGGQLQLELKQSLVDPVTGRELLPMVIPLRASLLDKAGQKVQAPELPQNGVLVLQEPEQSFSFSVPEGTLPVLLEDFSAPVRLKAPYSAEDYVRMLAHSEDPFIKADASFQLQSRYVYDCRAADGSYKTPESFIEACARLLEGLGVEDDLITAAAGLKVQTLQTLMETEAHIDLDALEAARRELQGQSAVALYDHYRRVYRDIRAISDEYSMQNLSRRSLNLTALHMLCVALCRKERAEDAAALVEEHYRGHQNMTDQLAALGEAVHLKLPNAAKLLDIFERRWSGDPLVFDNFFRLQATVPEIETVFEVRRLLSHPRYDQSNPNRIRALPGAMILQNPVALHRPDGAGYKLAYDIIAALNSSNTMMAARLLTPLLSFRRFDGKRQELMRTQLGSLLKLPDIARSVYEKVQAALQVKES
ncbi:MAG: aminopeptidase N [Succinivibrio sp.]|nr:aminopeptidase N [Succinivibrio sp.]